MNGLARSASLKYPYLMNLPCVTRQRYRLCKSQKRFGMLEQFCTNIVVTLKNSSKWSLN